MKIHIDENDSVVEYDFVPTTKEYLREGQLAEYKGVVRRVYFYLNEYDEKGSVSTQRIELSLTMIEAINKSISEVEALRKEMNYYPELPF